MTDKEIEKWHLDLENLRTGIYTHKRTGSEIERVRINDALMTLNSLRTWLRMFHSDWRQTKEFKTLKAKLLKEKKERDQSKKRRIAKSRKSARKRASEAGNTKLGNDKAPADQSRVKDVLSV